MNQKIPKKIHYFWFGDKKIPDRLLNYINDWEKKLPDYEIIEWNESNYDVNKILFTKQAYEKKKFAFVSDVARLEILYEYGGIYLDTDMEVVKDFTPFLDNDFFIGMMSDISISAGTIGTKPKNEFIKKMIKNYSERRFINEDGSLNLQPNVTTIREAIEIEHSWEPTDKNALTDLGEIVIYPVDYFCPERTNNLNKPNERSISNNTYAIHHSEGSWIPLRTKLKESVKNNTRRIKEPL